MLDDFQELIKRRVQEVTPYPYMVAEGIVWERYRDARRNLNPVPVDRMMEVAKSLGCRMSLSVWSYVYVYVFWWGGWEDHPFTEYGGTGKCGLYTPNNFQCNMPKEMHKAPAPSREGLCKVCGMVPDDHVAGNASCVNFPRATKARV